MSAQQRLGAQQRPGAARWTLFVALVCVLLCLVAGTARILHSHTDGAVNHADCSLCAMAHTSAEITHTPVPATTLPVSRLPERAEQPRPGILLSVFALYTRPPPTA
ncbi:MAG: hypothetical protein M3O02_06965 [Acidobacteriota bacterium]|nr:hypothetical protein [Acidobacteriota bacterium]